MFDNVLNNVWLTCLSFFLSIYVPLRIGGNLLCRSPPDVSVSRERLVSFPSLLARMISFRFTLTPEVQIWHGGMLEGTNVSVRSITSRLSGFSRRLVQPRCRLGL